MHDPATVEGSVAIRLMCPECGRPLAESRTSVTSCDGCGAEYPARPGHGPDLRPRHELRREARQSIQPADADEAWTDCIVSEMRRGRGPSLHDLDGVDYRYGNRLTDALASRLELRPGSRLLDLGCGDENQMLSAPIRRLGVEYVGIDYTGEHPDYLADAHCLPFADDSFDGALSIAVLEHVRYPYLAAQEVARVLRPGGTFAGTVAFLEPFHMDSVFHHTARGIWSVLHEAGFTTIEIEPNADWDVAHAIAEMGFLPGTGRRIPRWAGRFASRSGRLLQRMRGHEPEL
jgi:ubiquinone/menaquinone biosynthesis C-methylase UbiE/ribosomal protein L37AE/L43A